MSEKVTVVLSHELASQLDLLRLRPGVHCTGLGDRVEELEAEIASLKQQVGTPVATVSVWSVDPWYADQPNQAGRNVGVKFIGCSGDTLADGTKLFTAPALPRFAQQVLSKLQRFDECASDPGAGGVDIDRKWLDLLAQLGLLSRVQLSPARWEISEAGQQLLSSYTGEEGAGLETDAGRWRFYAPKVAEMLGIPIAQMNAEVDAARQPEGELN